MVRAPHNSRCTGIDTTKVNVRSLTKPYISQETFYRTIKRTSLVIDKITPSTPPCKFPKAIIGACANRMNRSSLGTIRPLTFWRDVGTRTMSETGIISFSVRVTHTVTLFTLPDTPDIIHALTWLSCLAISSYSSSGCVYKMPRVATDRWSCSQPSIRCWISTSFSLPPL